MAVPRNPRTVSRRDVLKGLAIGSVAAFLAACGGPTATATAGSSGPGGGTGTSASLPPANSGAGSSGAAPSGGSAGVPGVGSASPPSSSTASPTARVPALTLRQKIGQLLVVGFVGTKPALTSAVGKQLLAGELGGVILFDRNITSATQLAILTRGLKSYAKTPLLIAVDQEGGRVTRLGPAHGFRSVPSQEAVGARDDVDYARSVYTSLGKTLKAAGINLNLAPVVDVNVNPKNPAVGALDRAFSANPAIVTEMALVAIEAQHTSGVFTTPKHFPGLGSATSNTDFAVTDVTKTWSEKELDPYRDIISAGDADVIMVGNMLNGKLDKKYPSSLSRATVKNVLRGELGWAGPVITDDLQAVAITKEFTRTQALGLAFDAGIDLFLFGTPSASEPTLARNLVDTIVKMVKSGRINEERIDQSVARVALLRDRL
jgi:beta-N-acetylhexosaminidase